MKLKGNLKRLNGKGVKFFGGREYDREEIPAHLLPYFVTGEEDATKAEPEVIEKIIPAAGPFTKEQLDLMEKDQLKIIAAVNMIKVGSRDTNDDIIFEILKKQEADAEAAEGLDDGDDDKGSGDE